MRLFDSYDSNRFIRVSGFSETDVSSTETAIDTKKLTMSEAVSPTTFHESENITTTEDETKLSTEELRKKANNYAFATSNMGYGKKKKKLILKFWEIAWPELVELGWNKVDGEGSDAGLIEFYPPNMTKTKGEKGRDWFEKMRDVIDLILSKPNQEMAKIADLLLTEIEELVTTAKAKTSRSSRPRRSKAGTRKPGGAPHTSQSSLPGAKIIDLSWKDGGTTYPKRSSRVGAKYQVTKIPATGSATNIESTDYYELIWDPKVAQDLGVMSCIEEIPANKKEQALIALHECSYSAKDMQEKISTTSPIDGSDWSQDEKEEFHREIFRFRKDMKAVSRSIGKEMKRCLAYYLGSYKTSDHYRLLKTVCAEERDGKAESSVHGVDACAICGDGGNLLICDGCEGEYHMGCLRPALKAVPEGHWECDECVDRKFLEGRDYIIRNSSLYERFRSNEKKRKAEHALEDGTAAMADGGEVEDVLLCPSEPVLAAVRSLAIKISKTLTDVHDQAAPSEGDLIKAVAEEIVL